MPTSHNSMTQTIGSLPNTWSLPGTRWKHGNQIGIFGGHSQRMAMQDEKLEAWPDGWQLQPAKCDPMEIGVPLASDNFLPGSVQIHHVPNSSSRTVISQLYSHISSHAGTWPTKFCRASIPNLFTKQMLAHIHTLLKFSNQPHDLTGFLLCTTGEIMRLELGLTGQIFNQSTFDRLGDGDMDKTYVDYHPTSKYTPYDRYSRF